METKFERFEDLPEDSHLVIGDFLDLQTQATFAIASKKNYNLFQPTYQLNLSTNRFLDSVVTGKWIEVDKLLQEKPQLITQAVTQELANILLRFVATGNQDYASELMDRFPHLCTMPASCTDFANRTFTCSAFEYALWSFDRHMWTMLIKKILQNEEGKKIRQELTKQTTNIQSNGLTYCLNSESFQESHFNFEAVFIAYETLLDNYNHWAQEGSLNNHWDELDDLSRALRKAQDMLPVAVRNEFCRPDRSFVPTPSFDDETLPRGLDYFNYATGMGSSWSSCHSSGDFCIIRGARAAVADFGSDGAWRADFDAITAFYKIRTREYFQVNELLEIPIQKPLLPP